MPRVTIKKKDYMQADLIQWIIGRLYVKGLHQKDLGEKLGLSRAAMCARMKSGFFENKDLLIIFQYLDASDDEIIKLMKL